MNKMELASIGKNIRIFVNQRSPEILMGIGIAGMVSTTIFAVKATPKALMLIEERKLDEDKEELTPIETIQTTWKCYIPAAVIGVASISCLVGASRVSARRNAALATAYTLAETSLREYKDKVVETIGEEKEKEIRKAVIQEKIDKNPVSNTEVIFAGNGETLCYDPLSGRYFKSDVECIRHAVNELNRRLLLDGYISLNDFYDLIGLDDTQLGMDLGWHVDKGLVELDFGTQLAKDGTPCLVLDFMVAPIYDYNKWF